ncbi:hypothetical protein NDI37_05065 [Funiculus sociatus GB2-A5]|uniref:Uncharacterized protein n=1 Tax=Funiculus sociatus GB2-A5 TaxID=2933946 RepID=A0ABV0JK70_9CYAN|nr:MULTISPECIES: hypothetical protein [unclassified Trichocoleus]MBD1906837.1 hypothetical protein [Trichocoleus sp. FACHB-832]MBD2060892.1 hypothetical protein [Trichocoleus sp. FACHB-6]
MEAEKSVVAQSKGGEDVNPTIDKAYLVGWAYGPPYKYNRYYSETPQSW